MESLDQFGRPAHLVHRTLVCPAEYIEKARQLALHHMQNVEQAADDDVNRMFPTPLAPAGRGVPTHYYCSRWVTPEIVELEIQTMRKGAAAGETWIADRQMTLIDDPAELRSKACCIVADAVDVLSILGVQELIPEIEPIPLAPVLIKLS